MRFIDQARITVVSGKGGSGCLSFRREKYVPRGGPDGGNGGNGGDIIIKAVTRLGTLYDFTHKRLFRAKNGQPGEGNMRFGANADDLTIEVPVGTLVFNDDTNELLADLVEPDQSVIAAKGGIGGHGNKFFTTPTNRAPRKFQTGLPGEEIHLRLDLKLLADVALVGLPNAGKSTLISKISAAKPKIADYPFTTLTPNLGVVTVEGYEPFAVADIPGLIEGASEGVGLGHRFLRHIERTRLIVYMLDVANIDNYKPETMPDEAFEILKQELKKFSPELALRPSIVVLNKIDMRTGDNDPIEEIDPDGRPIFAISAAMSEGLDELTEAIAESVAERYEY